MKLLGTSIQNQYVNYDRRVPIDIAFFLFKGMLKRIW